MPAIVAVRTWSKAVPGASLVVYQNQSAGFMTADCWAAAGAALVAVAVAGAAASAADTEADAAPIPTTRATAASNRRSRLFGMTVASQHKSGNARFGAPSSARS